MKTRLSVIKSDGSIEQYMHTKVLHTIDRALASAGEADSAIAESMAEVVTYFLYGESTGSAVPGCEVLDAIKITLTAAGYDYAAEKLTEHHFHRRLSRNRVEVFNIDGGEPSDAEQLLAMQQQNSSSLWCKSAIIDDLVNRHGLDRNTARTVAAMVEEKILAMQVSRISSGLVRELVLNDAAALLHGQKQLQPA